MKGIVAWQGYTVYPCSAYQRGKKSNQILMKIIGGKLDMLIEYFETVRQIFHNFFVANVQEKCTEIIFYLCWYSHELVILWIEIALYRMFLER